MVDAKRDPQERADDTAELAEVIAQAAADVDRAERRALLRRAVGVSTGATTRLLGNPRSVQRWAQDVLVAAVPHLAIRDGQALRLQYNKSGDELAEVLIRNASRVAAGIGAVGGGLTTVEWVAPPTLLSVPVLIALETVAITAVEIRLIGELHEAYGAPVTGSVAQRSVSLLTAWTRQRGVTVLSPAHAMATVLSSPLRRDLRHQLLRKMGRNMSTVVPLFAGAAIAAELNRRATRSLGEKIGNDLRSTTVTRLPVR